MVSQLVVNHSQIVETTASTHEKIRALRGEISPVTIGRFSVRSMSRSRYMLNEAAEPALIAPPRTVARISSGFGNAPAARIITGTVVTSRSSITRGFVRMKYARMVRPSERGWVGSEAVPAT